MQQVTYGALKKPLVREEMLEEEMVSLGTKSGNYGVFTEQAKILTLKGAGEIMIELESLAGMLGHPVSAIFEATPTLKKLVG